MRLFPPSLEIGETEGFTPEKDIFGRAALGAGLTNLLSSVTDPTVIAVDGQWGSGKTTFLKMWAGSLRHAGFPVVYFDAFENDYSDDAFLAIAGEIIALAQEKKKVNTPKGKRLVKKAVGAGKVLLRSSIKLGVKGATLGLVGSTEFEDTAKDLASEASDLVDKYLGEMLTKQKEQKDAIQGFRDALAELPSLLTEKSDETRGDSPKPKPLVFIIDELDRCRPTFALEILERIKHFFSVQNVHFVLGVHLDQLRNSVVVAYGPNIDAQTYLQKFIQLTFHLVDRQRYRHEKTATKFIEYLQKVMDFRPQDRETVERVAELALHVAERRNLSLRAIERIMTNLAVALAYSPPNVLRPPPILAGLCILKVLSPELFAKAKRGQLVYAEVRDALDIENLSDEDGISDWYAKWWRYCTDNTFEEPEGFNRSLWQYNIQKEEIVPHVASVVIDRLQSGN